MKKPRSQSLLSQRVLLRYFHGVENLISLSQVDFDSEVLWEDGARTPPPPSPKRRRSSSVKRKPRPLSVPLQSKLALPAGIILGEITFEATFTEGWVGQDPCELQAADLAVLDGTCKVHQNKKDVGSLNWQNPELNDVVKGLGYLGHAQAILLIPKISVSAASTAMLIVSVIRHQRTP